MPIYVDIISRLDERSAAVAAARIERQFGAAGSSAGDAAGRGMSAAIDRSTSTIGQRVTGQFTTHGQAAGRNFGTGFTGQVGQTVGNTSGFTSALAGYQGSATQVGSLAGKALGTAFTVAAGGLIGAASLTLFKGFERYKSIDAAKNRLENLNRTLESTGRAGINVKAVMDTVTQAVTDTPFAMDKAFSVATRALASNTGDLKRFMTVVTDAAGFAGAGVDEIGDAFLKIANTGKVSMEEIGNELRNIPILPWLQEQLHVSGAELQKMISDGKVGLNDLMKAVESHASGFAKASGDTIEGAMSNMQTSVARLGANFLGAIFGKPTEDGNQLVDVLKTLRERIDEVGKWVTAHQGDIRQFFQDGVAAGRTVIEILNDLKNLLGGTENAIKLAGTAFVLWKTSGALTNVAELVTKLNKGGEALDVLPGKADAAGKGISAALARVVLPTWLTALLGNEIANKIDDHLPGEDHPDRSVGWAPGRGFTAPKRIWEMLTGQRDWNTGELKPPGSPGILTGPQVPVGVPQSQLTAPAGTRESGGVPQSGIDAATGLPAAQAHAPAGSRDPSNPLSQLVPNPARRDGVAPFSLGPVGGPSGNPILDAPGLSGDGSGSGPKLPDAPVVPFDTSLPPGIPGMPADASVFGAESSFLDARQKLAEKRARVAQLEATATATEDDKLNARNEAAAAERDLQAAEMRMGEARQNQYEQLTKSTDRATKKLAGLTKDLGEVGASLDADFGISKGLAGIAENITKFVANLAAAPLLGQLSAVEKLSPTQGGHGLMGVLGAQGVFGPMYQNNQYADMVSGRSGGSYSSYGRNGSVSGYFSDASLLANVPAGRYSQTGNADLTQGLADCSSAVEDLVNIMDGRPTGGRSMSTGNAAEWLTQHGFVQGMGGPGDFRVGYNGGHMQATLPGGTPFNWGSDSAAANRGIGGTGADDPSFTSHYYRPVGAPAAVSSYGSSGAAPTAPIALPTPSAADIYSPANTNPGLTNPVPTPSGGYGAGAPLPTSFGGGGAMAGGMPQGLLVGGPLNTTTIGANVAPPSGSGKGGVGMDGGGVMGMAMQAGGMALDAMAPGAGQAAQTGVKLINRAIQYGGQVAGIGAQGLMETLLPTGGSELANNNWLTRIVGGLAGAAPALPNLAGKGSEPLQPNQVDPNTTQHGQGQGQAPGPQITVNNNRQTEDGTGRDIAYHLQNMNSAPGM